MEDEMPIIGRIIMEEEMQRKHLQKKKLTKEIRSVSTQIKIMLDYISIHRFTLKNKHGCQK